jgi:hypothetical protein
MKMKLKRVFDEFLSIGSIEQKEFEEYNNSNVNITKRRRLKDSVSTYGLISTDI